MCRIDERDEMIDQELEDAKRENRETDFSFLTRSYPIAQTKRTYSRSMNLAGNMGTRGRS